MSILFFLFFIGYLYLKFRRCPSATQRSGKEFPPLRVWNFFRVSYGPLLFLSSADALLPPNTLGRNSRRSASGISSGCHTGLCCFLNLFLELPYFLSLDSGRGHCFHDGGLRNDENCHRRNHHDQRNCRACARPRNAGGRNRLHDRRQGL